MKPKRVFIIAAKRSTVAPRGGCLKNLNYDSIAKFILQSCIKQARLELSEIDSLIVSNAMGGGGNPARRCALAAGLPDSVETLSIDHQCVGGLDAIILAKQKIETGKANVVIAGGSESTSLMPRRFYKKKWSDPYRFVERPSFFPKDNSELSIAYSVNKLAVEQNITSQMQERWTSLSHQKALINKPYLHKEIHLFDKNQQIDPYARMITNDLYSRSKKIIGTINTCNTAPYADAAAFVVVVSEKIWTQKKLPFALEILETHTLGGHPQEFVLLPAKVIKTIIDRRNFTIKNISHLELMEAFAAQALLTHKELEIDLDCVNRSGGALARGHPIGASGAILMVRLFYELKKKNGIGLAAIAGVGGLASGILTLGCQPLP
jgi:acetyl-CoA C-acetyltransferase